ncbi:nuclear transport factor 2 family protein [Pseudonocardia sp. NPDC049635]|uniref:nuclear transport factor 2 family protein n=1 Tax=Pseudonocardia sp. NPDC049635 TaxID=3155506 RepID=UPI0033F8900B
MSTTGTTIDDPVVAAFVATVNRHDREGFLDAFIDGGVVDDWGRTFTGRDEIAAWSDREFIGSRGVLTPEEVRAADGAVTVVGDWRSTHANGRSSFTFQLDGSRIASMTIREG